MKILSIATLIVVAATAGCAPLSTEKAASNVAANSNARAVATPTPNSDSASILPFPEVPRINLADAKKVFDAGTAVFVDTHSPQMFDNEHIKSAVNVPFNEIDAHISKVPKDKTIITYCSCPAENTSAAVADNLIKKGQKNVFALEGGTNAWKSAGYPMDKKTN